jgi:hypothetical protein
MNLVKQILLRYKSVVPKKAIARWLGISDLRRFYLAYQKWQTVSARLMRDSAIKQLVSAK